METQTQIGLATPIRYLKGVGEARAEQLARLDINTVGDLLLTLPRRYEDRRQLQPMNALKSGDFTTVAGSVVSCGWVKPRFGKGFFEAILSDGQGVVRCRWFQAAYLKDQIRQGDQLVACGKVTSQKGEPVLQHPDFESVKEDGEASLNMGRIVPVYPLTDTLPQRAMRRITANAVDRYAALAEESLPAETIARWHLPPVRDALAHVHFPQTIGEARQARFRLVFEEFLCVQLVLVARKIYAERFINGIVHDAPGRLRGDFLRSLPFQLTIAQERAMGEIRADMARPHPMHRLLQGDVGSGKTVVAVAALLDAIECGSQGAIMAPTEILAAQHALTMAKYLAPLGIKLELLTSSLTPSEKISARAAIADGRTRLVIGTHALIEDRVVFKRLGLVVIDEQHKFGVEQRGLLYEKGDHPDVLVMTATPIPRTLAMTLYGDLDLTIIDEMPRGRKEIVTRVIKESQLPQAYDFIRKQVAKGRQAYIVYPLVSESDASELKSAGTMFEQLGTTEFAGLQVGLLHGQMKNEEKDRVMDRFRRGQIHILVATTVVEVGVDVPNATVMLVENAERFGLAQLHQLRGRIGRGEHKSFCVLQSASAGLDAWQRLKVMEQTTDGFRIAEEDFRIRGMGNILGREQSGVPSLRVGDLLADMDILEAARKEAVTLIDKDPTFENPDYENLRSRARALYRIVGPFVKVG
ncbi:MAG: ATP-dependent DNA helicase RecG [bacterium]